MTKNLLKSLTCSSALCLEFYDLSNRYYGDFHQLRIEVELLLGGEAQPTRLCYQRPLRRMAVTSALLAEEKNRLITEFLATTLVYFESATFVQKLRLKLQAGEYQVWKPVD